MKLSKQEAIEAVYGDAEDWKEVTPENISSTGRWSTYKVQIFQHVPSGKLYRFNWSVGSTEIQDEGPFEYEDYYEPTEVVAVEKLVTVYEPVTKK